MRKLARVDLTAARSLGFPPTNFRVVKRPLGEPLVAPSFRKVPRKRKKCEDCD